MPTMEDVYRSARLLPTGDRLRLAAQILDEIVNDPRQMAGYSEEWSDDDIKEFSAQTAHYLDSEYPEEQDFDLPRELVNVQPR